MIINFVSFILVGLGGAIISAFYLNKGLEGIWFSWLLSLCLINVLLLAMLFFVKWAEAQNELTKRLTKEKYFDKL